MKINLLCFALVLSGGLFQFASVAHGADEPPAIKVMIDIPAFGQNGKITQQPTLGNRYPNDDHFYVVIENISSKPAFLKTGNSEILGLSFEVTTNDGKKITINRLAKPTAKYVFGELAVLPGQVTVQPIYYGRDWENFPFPDNPGQPKKVVLRALLSESPPKESEAKDTLKGHWTGKVVSEPHEIFLLKP